MWFNILPKNKSVRKTILNVVSIYLITTILLILTLSFIYVDSQKDQLLQSQKQQIDYQAKQLINQLEDLHNGISNNNIMYPELDDIQTAIYDIDKNIIFSTFGEKNIEFDKTDFHIHFPEGAVPKDGPSAGIAITTALTSLITKKPVKKKIAMTGEVTITGRVLPVGGIKEKFLAAYREKVKVILYPKTNEKDVSELPEKVKKTMKLIPVSHMDEVLKKAL